MSAITTATKPRKVSRYSVTNGHVAYAATKSSAASPGEAAANRAIIVVRKTTMTAARTRTLAAVRPGGEARWTTSSCVEKTASTARPCWTSRTRLGEPANKGMR
ncbi:hypothetical protein PW035_49770 [Nonomuraea angiospora]|nr:hypothetical protein [Nonomuraea angiospora]MDX3108979.1 hypothetical protein [Nonomuraea angiospora]